MHKALLCLLTSMLFTFTASVQAQDVAWNMDANHSSVGFVAKHLGFAKVRGEFKKFSATFTADAKTGKLASLEAAADAKSVSTDNEKRDNHLKSEDFFAADKFPEIKLKSKSIKWNGNHFTAVVALTMRGTTKDVTFEGDFSGVQMVNFGSGAHLRGAYEASAKINRKDFGLNFAGVAEGIALVSDEVTIELAAEISYTPKS
jgi:polyisoprenoid-binding protein YceI